MLTEVEQRSCLQYEVLSLLQYNIMKESISRTGWIYWCKMLYTGTAFFSGKLNSYFGVKHLYIDTSASKFKALLF